MSPSSQRVWIEIGVGVSVFNSDLASPSSQRVWIEIREMMTEINMYVVTLFTEGVD